uniref:ShKT domain-containing protein n=1 Tax=Steinernema glaseri TaxID=37863 RepID=A0A1I7ZID6_9BILA
MASLNAIVMLSLTLLATVLLLESHLVQARADIPCSNLWSDAECRKKSYNGNEFLCGSDLTRGKHLRAACKKTCHLCEPTDADLDSPKQPFKPSEQSTQLDDELLERKK